MITPEDVRFIMRRAEIGSAHQRRSHQSGRVYFIRCGDYVKIGYAINPRQRLRAIAAANPYRCTLLGSVPGGIALEQELHAKHARLRGRGEWFRCTQALLDEIKDRCKFAKRGTLCRS